MQTINTKKLDIIQEKKNNDIEAKINEKIVEYDVKNEIKRENLKVVDILSYFSFIEFSIGTALGIASKDFIYEITDSLVLPILSIGLNIKNLNNAYVYNLGKSNIYFGKVLYDFIRFIILILLILILINYIMQPMIKKIIEIRTTFNKQLLRHVSNIDTSVEKINYSTKKDTDISPYTELDIIHIKENQH